MKSTLYKLILKNRVIAEGSASAMRKLRKRYPESFVGVSPSKKIGDTWNEAFPAQ